MRRFFVWITAILMAAFCVSASSAGNAYAADPVDNAIATLQASNVHVEPGTPGTDTNTVSYLQSFLRPGDHIVIVMLDKSDKTADEIAAKILGSLPEKSVLGLYVNGETSAYSNRPYVPATTASTTLVNARTISMNPSETLATFVRQIHVYQASNPEPVETVPTTATPAGETYYPQLISGGSLLLAAVIIVTVLFRRRNTAINPSYNVRFKQTPAGVRDTAREVLGLRSQITDRALTQSLSNIGKYLEAYFKNAKAESGGSYKGEDEIRANVLRLQTVVERYIKVQDEPEYYREAAERQAEYAHAVQSFESFMLEQVRNANADEEFDVRKAANILKASELRSIRPNK